LDLSGVELKLKLKHLLAGSCIIKQLRILQG
jgi:hypothetical protein